MRTARKSASRRPAQTPVAALLAVFALLIQALTPSAAMAAQGGASDETVIVCTQMGVQVLKLGDAGAPTKGGFAGLPCQDCLAPALAATLPAPERLVLPVAYEAHRVEHVETADVALRGARAPPRPPGQGPPAPNV